MNRPACPPASPAGSTHFGDALLSTCLSTLSQLMEARTRCAAVAAVAGQALLADSAAAACAANAAVLCKVGLRQSRELGAAGWAAGGQPLWSCLAGQSRRACLPLGCISPAGLPLLWRLEPRLLRLHRLLRCIQGGLNTPGLMWLDGGFGRQCRWPTRPSLDCPAPPAPRLQELAAAGAVPASAQGAADLCFSASSERGGSFLDSLRMALQWRHSCDPAVNACCLPLPASSFLSTRLAIRGVVPLTAAACSELPGCLPDSWCWPTWGKDACRSFTNSTDCMDEEACQARRGSLEWFRRRRADPHLRLMLILSPPHPAAAPQWYSWGNGAGNCADASLTAKCRLAGAV